MDIIEKETVKEVPVEYWQKSYNCGYPYGYNAYGTPSHLPASRGVAGAGLGLN